MAHFIVKNAVSEIPLLQAGSVPKWPEIVMFRKSQKNIKQIMHSVISTI